MTVLRTELDALLDRVREDKADTTGKNRNAVAYDCWRMFEDLAAQFKEESTMRDRYKRQSDSWRDKALELAAREWMPIETAPKTGEPLLGFMPTYYRGKGGMSVILWLDGAWFDNRAFVTEPSHWQPLPEPPK